MKWIIYSALAMIVAMMSACDSSTFRISVDVQSLGNQNVHVVFLGDSGVTDKFIPTQDNKFSVEGSSSNLTVVNILDSQNKPLFRVAVKGGETIEITGDYNNPHHYHCKGSEVAQAWMDFESENAALYSKRGDALDAAIEKYVEANRSSVVSTLLLVFDYSDLTTDKAKKMLASIDEKARPASLVESMEQLIDATGKPVTQLRSMLLCRMGGDFEVFSLSKSRSTLILWWSENGQQRREQIAAIKRMSKQYGDKLSVADVTLNSDTSAWRAIVNADSTQWAHYWAPGGILDQSIVNLKLRKLPVCIVVDSTGKQLYRGADMQAAQSTLNKYLNN